MTTAPRLRRLRFAYHRADDESAIGAFVSGCHEHRLRSVARGLEGAGLGAAHPGRLQMATMGTLAAAAWAMRTDVELLGNGAFSAMEHRDRIALGDVVLPRSAIDMQRRRIGPRSLLERQHHRLAWLNMLLPYCPTSLELLVDECPACGPLGWRHTRGIGNCEQCGVTVPPSRSPDLADELVEGYRHFADLGSRDTDVGSAAGGRLPRTLQSFTRTTLVTVLIRSGMLCVTGGTRSGVEPLLAAGPATVVAAMCAGMRILAEWPRPLQAFAKQRVIDLEDDVAGYQVLRGDIRRLGRGSIETGKMIADAFPTLDGRIVDTFGPTARTFYSASETNLKLGTSSKELERLRDAAAFGFEKLPSIKRFRARYDADDVDHFGIILRNCTPPGNAAVHLDIPTYAVGQLAESGRLLVEKHPGVLTLRGLQVTRTSLTDLEKALRSRAQDTMARENLIPIRTAMLQFPGEKSWAQVIEGMLRGTIPFQLKDDALSIRDALIEPARIAGLAMVPGNSADPLGITHIAMRDAYEILATGGEEAMPVITAARISVVRYGPGKGVARGELRELVAKVAFSGEAAARTGRSAISLNHEFSRLGIPKVHAGWSRAALVKMGMVAAVRMPTAPPREG